MFVHKLLSCFTSSHLQGSHWITGYGKWYWPQSTDNINSLQTVRYWSVSTCINIYGGICICVYKWRCVSFCVVVPVRCTCIHTSCTYLVCWHQVDQHGVQQLLRYSVSLADDGAHQVYHMHVHLLVVAVARETRQETLKIEDGIIT